MSISWNLEMGRLLEQGRSFACITIIDSGGSSPREIGAKMLVLPDGTIHGSVGGGELERQLILEATNLLKDGKIIAKKTVVHLSARTGQCCGGVVEAFLETYGVAIPFYIFGAGHVGEEIASLLHGTLFRPILVDERPQWPRLDRIPPHVTIERSHKKVLALLAQHGSFYSAILTHSHDLDFELVRELLAHPFAYLGLIGSHTKRTRFYSRLQEAGIKEEQLSKLDCPMGINLGGGKTPREVAISLAAKILSIYYANRADN